MIKKMLMLLMVLSLAGCSTVRSFYNSPHPGSVDVAGGEMQLFYSNPNRDLYPFHSEYPPSVFDNGSGSPHVSGGVGLEGKWKF